MVRPMELGTQLSLDDPSITDIERMCNASDTQFFKILNVENVLNTRKTYKWAKLVFINDSHQCESWQQMCK